MIKMYFANNERKEEKTMEKVYLTKLVAIIKGNKRMDLVILQDLRRFAKEIGIENVRKIHKPEIMKELENQMNEGNVMDYLKRIENLGICKCNLQELTGLRNGEIEKLLEKNEIEPHHVVTRKRAYGGYVYFYVYGYNEIVKILKLAEEVLARRPVARD